jgi:hypothetical protein
MLTAQIKQSYFLPSPSQLPILIIIIIIISVLQLGRLLIRSGLTYPEVLLKGLPRFLLPVGE